MDWQSIVRNLLMLAGGWITSQGWMSQSDWEIVVGAIMIIVAAILKWWVGRAKKAEVKSLKLKISQLENK